MTRATPRKSASRLSPGKRIADIVAAARLEIAANGYDGTSMLAVAQRAGVVEGTLYRFFKTKQDLMLRVAEQWLEELLAEDFGLGSIRGTWNRLRHLIWRGLQLMHNEPAISRFVMFEMRPSAAYRTTRVFQLNRRFTGEVRAVCEEAMQTGEFRNDVSPARLEARRARRQRYERHLPGNGGTRSGRRRSGREGGQAAREGRLPHRARCRHFALSLLTM
jgi:TetR/AcrR family fatty acid metabolism transcriptional regulator